MNNGHDLELRLRSAQERHQQALAALAPKHKGGEWEEYHAAHQEVLALERQVATVTGEEYAEQCGFPLRWDAGAPMPHLMVNDRRALLAFLLSEPDPAWGGSSVTMKGPDDDRPEPLGRVEFEFCTSAKLGAPNNEVFEGHPLNGRGVTATGHSGS